MAKTMLVLVVSLPSLLLEVAVAAAMAATAARIPATNTTAWKTSSSIEHFTCGSNAVTCLMKPSSIHILLQRLKPQGLLNSDQEMFSSLVGIGTRHLVQLYTEDAVAFFKQFAVSMVKLGNIVDQDSFVGGEVRKNCRFINSFYVLSVRLSQL